jgi:hypothetical protein
MTAATPEPSGLNFLSVSAGKSDGMYRVRRESFVLSLLGQAAVVGVFIYLTSCVIKNAPGIEQRFPRLNDFPVIFCRTKWRRRRQLRQASRFARKSAEGLARRSVNASDGEAAH